MGAKDALDDKPGNFADDAGQLGGSPDDFDAAPAPSRQPSREPSRSKSGRQGSGRS